MRDVVVSARVQSKIADLKEFLTQEYRMSRRAANARISRIHASIMALGNPGDYALCRFRAWREAGYHCIAFEGWVFAYEVFGEGVIIRDMAHGKALDDTAE
jgi:hypothetical protein